MEIFALVHIKNLRMGTVIKHIPGHGYANLDSHKILPSVLLKNEKLKKMILTVLSIQKVFLP